MPDLPEPARRALVLLRSRHYSSARVCASELPEGDDRDVLLATIARAEEDAGAVRELAALRRVLDLPELPEKPEPWAVLRHMGEECQALAQITHSQTLREYLVELGTNAIRSFGRVGALPRPGTWDPIAEVRRCAVQLLAGAHGTPERIAELWGARCPARRWTHGQEDHCQLYANHPAGHLAVVGNELRTWSDLSEWQRNQPIDPGPQSWPIDDSGPQAPDEPAEE